jgi:hypothetical protein
MRGVRGRQDESLWKRGSFSNMVKREATIEDLYRVPDKAKIVNGELVIMTPAGGLHGYAVSADQVVWDVLEDHVVRVYRAADPELDVLPARRACRGGAGAS